MPETCGFCRERNLGSDRAIGHADQLPAKVWWARWDGVEGDVAEQQEVSLDSQHAVHRYLRTFATTVAGFHWEWPDGAIQALTYGSGNTGGTPQKPLTS